MGGAGEVKPLADKALRQKRKSREEMAEAMYRACNLASQAQREEMLIRLIGQMTPENAQGWFAGVVAGQWKW